MKSLLQSDMREEAIPVEISTTTLDDGTLLYLGYRPSMHFETETPEIMVENVKTAILWFAWFEGKTNATVVHQPDPAAVGRIGKFIVRERSSPLTPRKAITPHYGRVRAMKGEMPSQTSKVIRIKVEVKPGRKFLISSPDEVFLHITTNSLKNVEKTIGNALMAITAIMHKKAVSVRHNPDRSRPGHLGTFTLS